MVFLGLALYMDRVLRREVIFDSSALTCTVFLAHVLNICRSSIAHVDSVESGMKISSYGPRYALATAEKQGSLMLIATDGSESGDGGHLQQLLGLRSINSSFSDSNKSAWSSRGGRMDDAEWARHSTLSPATHAMTQQQQQEQRAHAQYAIPWWQENAAYLAYIGASVLLLLDIDVLALLMPVSTSCTAVAGSHGSIHAPRGAGSGSSCHLIRVSTVVMHCILVGIILQLSVDQSTFMSPIRVMARSFVFTGLSLCWTYAVGIHEACFATRDFPYYASQAQQQQLQMLPPPCGDECEEEDNSGPLTFSTNRGSSSCRRKKGSSSTSSPHASSLHRHHTRGGGSESGDGQHTPMPIAAVQNPSAASYVQGFTPCQLRFTVLLFTDSWHMVLAAVAMGLIMGDRLQKVACSGVPTGNNVTLPAAAAQCKKIRSERSSSRSSEQGLLAKQLPSSQPHATTMHPYLHDAEIGGGWTSAAASAQDRRGALVASAGQRQQHHHHHLHGGRLETSQYAERMRASGVEESFAMDYGSVEEGSRHVEKTFASVLAGHASDSSKMAMSPDDNARNSSAGEPDMLELFRQAQRHAGMERLGEMI